jgi:FkbM family methyltransferase
MAGIRGALARTRRRLADWLVPRAHRARVFRTLGKRLLRNRVVRQPFHGGVICLDAVEHSWAWTGTPRLESWDRPIQDRLLALSRDCETMIDVGGNIGTMTLAVALRNPAVRIVCVEPNARAARLLRQSLALNDAGDRVTVIDAVAGEADGHVGFLEGGSTTGHVVQDGALRKPSIDFARLVDESAARGRCLVKIDVEGFETVLLKQLRRVQNRRRLVLMVELHAGGFNGVGDPRACVALLREGGGIVTDLSGGPVTGLAPWTDPLETMQVEARWPQDGDAGVAGAAR